MTRGPMNPMNPNDGGMHPEDRRNLIIFIVLALVFYFAFDHFILQPKIEAMRLAQTAAQTAASGELPGVDGDTEEVIKTRDEIVASSRRAQLKGQSVFGTLPLTGNRIDDIELTRYFKTLGGSDHVEVLAPAGTAHPKYAEFGWVPENKSTTVPGKDTAWQVVSQDDKSVTATWSNGAGLKFERIVTLDDKYVMTVTQRVTNATGGEVTLFPYALIAGVGLPEEFSKQTIAHQGPIGYIGDKLHEIKYKELDEKGAQTYSAMRGWAGITEKYWIAALLPQQGEMFKYRFVSTPGARPAETRYQADILGAPRALASGESAESTIHLYAGAKEVRVLDAYEDKLSVPHFDLAVDFGLYYFLTKPFFWLLSFLGHAIGNFGVAIIIFTIILRGAMFPLNNTSYRSFAKLKKVAPEMAELREKYSDDKQKLQQELVALYAREKVNPAAGCVPILLQIPIFFALYKVLSVTIEMRHAPFFGWIEDLSVADPTTVFNLFGLLPFTPPSFLMIGAWPCMMLVAMLVQRQMNPPPQDKVQAQMLAMMPYFMTYIMSQFAAGLVIYWTVSNILSVAQQYVIMRSMGVEVKFFHKTPAEEKLAEEVAKGPAVHPQAEMLEEKMEEALETAITLPKPRKKKKKK